jgi:AcrR family transcriptional regulator
MATVSPVQKRRGRPVDPERVLRKREQILKSAAACFGANGYSGTDIDAVARAAGITKGTVYHYFESKEDLFLATVDFEANRLRLFVLEAADAAEDSLDELAAAIYAYLRFFEDNPHVVELFVEERSTFKDREKHTYFIHRDMTLARWHQLWQRMIDEKKVRQVDSKEYTSVLSDTLYGTVFTNYFAGTKLTAADQAKQILDVAMGGILLEPHRFRFD